MGSTEPRRSTAAISSTAGGRRTRSTPDTVEIASILVQALPEQLDAAARAIEALPGAQIYSRDPKGKLVVVIEAADVGGIGATLNTISLMPDVLTAALVFHGTDTAETTRMRPAMKNRNRIDRREFLKLEAAAMAAAAGGMPAPAAAQNLVTDRSITELKWDKAPCRFCGTGCGVMVATKDGRVVATHGDTKAEVNRGLNCVKGYFLSKIMYGHDRLTHPLLRKKNGKYDKNGEFTPVSWDEAFDVMAEKFKDALRRRGPTASACSARANGQSGKATRPTSCSRPASAPTTSIRTRAIAWHRPSWASCAHSAWTSRWAATTISRPPTHSCCGARTWRRCTRSCGAG